MKNIAIPLTLVVLAVLNAISFQRVSDEQRRAAEWEAIARDAIATLQRTDAALSRALNPSSDR